MGYAPDRGTKAGRRSDKKRWQRRRNDHFCEVRVGSQTESSGWSYRQTLKAVLYMFRVRVTQDSPRRLAQGKVIREITR